MPRELHSVGPTPATYPLHLACLACAPSVEFFSLRHLVEHLEREHPRAFRVVEQ